MQRFNAFLLVHKGLRAMLYDLSLSLQHTDFAHAKDYPHALEKLEAVVKNFEDHAFHEDNHFFPLLESCAPALLDEMEREHQTDHALGHKLRELMAAYRNTNDADEKGAIGNKILYAYYEFLAFNLTHLNKEEVVVNEVLWNHYTDLQLIQANQRLVSSIAPEDAKMNVVWMMRGCNNREIINWIGAIKNQIPAPMLQMLMQIAEQELPAHRWEVVQGAIMEIA